MFNMSNVKSTIMAHHSMTPILQLQIDPYERLFSRFFLIPKRFLILAYSKKRVGQQRTMIGPTYTTNKIVGKSVVHYI